MNRYYLDANAHVPVNLSSKSQSKLNTIKNGYGLYGHPLVPSFIGSEASILLEKARHDICKLIGISEPSKLHFTHSCTESNDWAIQLIQGIKLDSVFVSPFEHPSMNDALDSKNIVCNFMSIDNDGNILNEDKCDAMVCIGVQSEIGVITDLERMRKNTSQLLITDLSQAIGKIPINIDKLGIDIATFGAHKFGGPSGIGFLYLRDDDLWMPYGSWVGTSYSRDIAGSPNVEGAIIASLALEDSISTLKERTEKCLSFRTVLEQGLKELGFDIICENGNRVYNTTFARVPNGLGALLLRKLSDMNIAIGLGSACGSFMIQDSKIMLAMKLHEPNTSFIRISQHGYYDASDASYVLDSITRALKVI